MFAKAKRLILKIPTKIKPFKNQRIHFGYFLNKLYHEYNIFSSKKSANLSGFLIYLNNFVVDNYYLFTEISVFAQSYPHSNLFV
jgi:hypothetical protein